MKTSKNPLVDWGVRLASTSGRMMRSLTLLLCVLPLYGLTAAGQERQVLTESCEACRIELVSEDTLSRGGEEYGGVSPHGLLERDGQGRYLFRNVYVPSTILVFTSTGEFSGTFGASGPGPEEFQQITAMVVGRGDTLRIFDGQQGTYTVVSPELEIVRRIRIEAAVSAVIELASDSLVIASDWRTPDRFGYPIHFLVEDQVGAVIGSAEAIESSAAPEPFGLHRTLARGYPDGFWSAHGPNFVIDQFSSQGDHLRRLEGVPTWFEKLDRSTLRGRMNPLLNGLVLDDDGIMWVLIVDRAESFDQLAFEDGRINDLPNVRSRTGSLDDLQEAVIVAINPTEAEILASIRLPLRRATGFLEPDRVFGYVDADSGGSVLISRLRLRGYNPQ